MQQLLEPQRDIEHQRRFDQALAEHAGIVAAMARIDHDARHAETQLPRNREATRGVRRRRDRLASPAASAAAERRTPEREQERSRRRWWPATAITGAAAFAEAATFGSLRWTSRRQAATRPVSSVNQ